MTGCEWEWPVKPGHSWPVKVCGAPAVERLECSYGGTYTFCALHGRHNLERKDVHRPQWKWTQLDP